METIYEQFFKILNNSYIEKLLEIILITDDISESDRKMIEILIQNDKNMNFKRIKYMFILEFISNFGFFADRVNDRQVFKILTSVITIYNRKYVSEVYRNIEKEVIIKLEKTCFKSFNTKTTGVIFKNIEKNKNMDDSIVQNIYLESYNNILIIYETYTIIIQKLFNFITELILLTLTPFFFDQRHGIIRSTFNIFFAIGYVVSEFFYIFKDFENELDDDTKDITSNEFEVKNNILNLFRNINIIIENNTIKEELSLTLNNIMKLLKNDDFRQRYEFNRTKKGNIKRMAKYKIIETFASILINDAYLFNLTAASETAMIELGENLAQLQKKLPLVRSFINILHAKPYYTQETVLWTYTSENIFTLENVTIEYEENDKIIHIILENVDLNFEVEKSHFIYGNSGCGKTTLLNAIMKKIKIKNGSIHFFGLDYTYFSIRKYLSYVTSESALFSKSLYYNITYGLNKKIVLENKNEIMTKITEYMKLFGLEKFISNIQTKNALKLSKGQTQRIVIIRLFIHVIFGGRKILFLDEFTSNIDNDMEKIIFTELRNLQKIHLFTSFYISHNLYNKKYSDYIYEIKTNTRSIIKKINTEYECDDE
jgi:ABC-type multidrug transport system fused ATPase/permease subunit